MGLLARALEQELAGSNGERVEAGGALGTLERVPAAALVVELREAADEVQASLLREERDGLGARALGAQGGAVADGEGGIDELDDGRGERAVRELLGPSSRTARSSAVGFGRSRLFEIGNS